ncbi:MAG: glycosyl hydrolase [Saprospiraceae bacterium]|nr:glycosyl hydrolase [Saprospiraceae bacterium]
MEARAIGPAIMGGRITAIEGLNSDPRTLYIGTAGGGVWKTRTGGYTFEPLFDKHPQSIGAMAIDQQHPDTVWVGTGESNMRNSVSIGLGMYRSTDGGRNWVKRGLENSEHISKIILHPQNPNVLYVAVPGKLWSDSPDRGLYKTTDGGQTWEKILYTDAKTGCADVLMDPRNPEVLWASMWQFRRTPYSFVSGGPGSALFKSTDGGKTWRKLTQGLPTGEFGRIAMALAPSAPDNLLAIVESEKTGLYISADGGENWKRQSSTDNVTARPFYFSTLVVDPYEPKRVYRPAFSLSISSDGGYSFSDASDAGGWVHSDHHALWINPQNTHQMYLGTDGGVYTSLDRGVTWSHLNTLPVSQFYHVQVDNQVPYQVYGGLQDNGSWCGPSASPGGIENRDWDNVGGGDGFWVQPDDQDPDIVFSESQGGNISRLNRKTNQTQLVQPQARQGDPKLRWNWNTPVVKSPVNPKVLYIGAQFLYKTTDRGHSWSRVSPDLTTNDPGKQQQYASGGLTVDNSSAENHCTIFAIAPSPLDENLLFVGTDDGNIQRTVDGGKNWTDVTPNLPGIPRGTWVSSVESSRFTANTLYATFDNHAYGDTKPYVAKSTDQGKTWTALPLEGVQGFAHVIREDRVNANLLFLGTEFGLYLSNDGGASWILYKSGIPEYVAVRDIVIHPRTNDLVLATHGRGVYIVDDISPLRLLTPELLQRDAALLPVRPTPVSTGHYSQSFPSTGSYIGANSTEEAQVIYYLKNRVSTGDVTVDILDEKGNVLLTIPGSKRKGINVVPWSMRLKPPKAAKGVMVRGEAGVFAGAFGPLALPGRYGVRLNTPSGKDSATLVLVPDPLSPGVDLAGRKAVSDTLFQMVEELAFLVAQVQNLKDSVQQRVGQVKSKSLKTRLSNQAGRLDAMHKTLTETTVSSGITGEEKLRVFIGRLYVFTELSDLPPTASTLQRMRYLQTELQKEKANAGRIFSELKSLNADLQKEKLPAVVLLDKDAFLKNYNAPASGSKSGLDWLLSGIRQF